MIYYQYFFNNGYIVSWKAWNPGRNLNDIEYQALMTSIENNPAPTGEMNASYVNNGRLYNPSTNNNFKIEDNKIITIQYVKTNNEIFEEKYTLNKIVNILANGIINPANADLQELKNDLLSIDISKIGDIV